MTPGSESFVTPGLKSSLTPESESSLTPGLKSLVAAGSESSETPGIESSVPSPTQSKPSVNATPDLQADFPGVASLESESESESSVIPETVSFAFFEVDTPLSVILELESPKRKSSSGSQNRSSIESGLSSTVSVIQQERLKRDLKDNNNNITTTTKTTTTPIEKCRQVSENANPRMSAKFLHNH